MYCIVNLGYTMLMRPNGQHNLIRLSMVYPTQIQSQVHSLPTTEDTDTSNFNTSRIFNNFNISKGRQRH